MPRVFLLDNEDSFTYNLAQQLEVLGARVCVRRACPEVVARCAAFGPSHLLISPGPKRPEDHPAIAQLLERYVGQLPILGVCLGMQAINLYCGGTLRRAPVPLHGKTSVLRHAGQGVLADVSPAARVARYHSLLVDQLGDELEVIGWAEDECVMAIQHRRLPIYGVQFHPESFLSPEGDHIMRRWLQIC